MQTAKGGACDQRRSLPNTPTSLVKGVGLEVAFIVEHK